MNILNGENGEITGEGFIGNYKGTPVIRIYFAKLKREAIMPSKEDENMAYDIYACFDEDEIYIQPGEIKLIPTGIMSACSEDYGFILKERGSTGTKGMSQRCGVIDSGYRGEWFIPINNTTNKSIIITKDIITTQSHYAEGIVTIYPDTKAICQALLIPVPKTEVVEMTVTEMKRIPSKRGMRHLGSSGK